MSHKLSLSFMLSSIVFVQAAMDKFVQSDLLQSGPNSNLGPKVFTNISSKLRLAKMSACLDAATKFNHQHPCQIQH